MLSSKVFTLFLFLCLFERSLPYTFNGFEIRDLEYTGNDFIAETTSWTASGLVSGVKHTTCGTYLLGGPSVLATICNIHNGNYGWCSQWGSYFTKTFYNLPAHTYVFFSVNYWTFRSWDLAWDYFELVFDSLSIDGWKMSAGNFATTTCGVTTQPNIKIYGRFPHTASSITVTFYSRMDEDTTNESWGVRDLNMLFVRSPTVTGTSYCAAPWTLPNLPTSWRCPFSTVGYYGTTLSTACNAACASCYGAGSNQCYECNTGYFFNGASCLQCHSFCSVCYGTGNDQCSVCKNGYYLWAGNTCLAACDPPLVQSAGDTTNVQYPIVSQTICNYPCTQGFYLDWYGDCKGSCDYPLQATTRRTGQDPIYVCNYPCAIGQYLYWDGMCENSCSIPVYSVLVYTGVNDGRYFCKFPCTTTANPIAYWDGSCCNKCDFPLIYVIEHNKEFCTNPCTTPGYYLYNNGSCLPTCQTYFEKPGDIAGQELCNYPCTSGQYLYSNGTCLATCNSLFYNLTMLADKYCYYPCLPTEWLYNNGSCLKTCDWRFKTRTMVGEKYCDFPCLPRVYLYLNGTCQTYCRTYFNPWFDKKTSTDYYCDNPCNKSIMLNNGTCRANCDTRYISYSGGSDKYCDYPCPPSHYLYTNGSCLMRCDSYYWKSDYLGDRFCDNPCLSGEFVSYNGSCKTTCNSPYIPQTFGSDNFCRSPCKAGDYLYSNNTCRSWCTPGFIESSYGVDKFCNYPCTSGQFLYQDGTCKSTCQTYFVQVPYGTEKFCNFPCAVEKYLYQNGSCLSSCHLLFVEAEFSGTDFKYCQRPCSVSTDWIYWDGSCGAGCTLPYIQRIEGTNNKLCVYPCEIGDEYLYWNGSCLSTCEFPLRSRTETDLRKYCDYPCTSLESLRWDGECVDTCVYPLRIKSQSSNTEILCLPPCDSPDEYFYQETGSCSTYCDSSLRSSNTLFKICSGTSQKTTGIINSLSTPPSDPRAVSFILPARMIQYVKYLDITLPPRLERLSQGKGNPPLWLTTAGLLIPEDAMPVPSQQILPVVFWKQGLSQGFLVNFWQPLMILALLFTLGTIFAVVEALCAQAGWFDWKEIFERLRIIVLWNLIIMVIATNLDNIILYSSLEIRAKNQGNKVNAANLVFCIISIIAGILVFVVTSVIAPKNYFMKPNGEKPVSSMYYARFLTKWQTIQVVFRGFREDSLMTGLFYAFYLVRISVPSLIAAVIYTSPLAQSCLYVGISVSMIWYLLHSDPLKKRVNQIQIVLTELLVLAVNTCILILSVSETEKAENDHTRVFLGDLIIICNFGINIIGVVFLGIKLFLGIRTVIILRKSKKYQCAKITMLQLLFLPFQQAAFGFEQVQVARFFQNYSKLTNYKSVKKSNNLRSQVVNSKDQERVQTSPRVSYETNISLESESSSFPINKISKRLNDAY